MNAESMVLPIGDNKNIIYIKGGDIWDGSLLVKGSTSLEVVEKIASINGGGCKFYSEGGVKEDKKNHTFYASRPVGPCEQKYE